MLQIFHFLKRVTKGKHLWLRNNGSTLVSQMVDSFAVIFIAHFMTDAFDLKGTPNKFRNTWASHATMDGVPMNQIAAMLGDTQKTVEKNYLHLSPDYLRSAVNRDSESYAVTPQIAQVAL